jgi:hypothetical protein
VQVHGVHEHSVVSPERQVSVVSVQVSPRVIEAGQPAGVIVQYAGGAEIDHPFAVHEPAVRQESSGSAPHVQLGTVVEQGASAAGTVAGHATVFPPPAPPRPAEPPPAPAEPPPAPPAAESGPPSAPELDTPPQAERASHPERATNDHERWDMFDLRLWCGLGG